MTVTVDPPETDKPASGSLPLPRLPQSYPPLLRALLIRAVALGAFLLAWWAVTAAKLIEPLFLPSPAVCSRFRRGGSMPPVHWGRLTGTRCGM